MVILQITSKKIDYAKKTGGTSSARLDVRGGPSCYANQEKKEAGCGARGIIGLTEEPHDAPHEHRSLLVEIDEEGEKVDCTPKLRQEIKGPATLNGGERCWCPDNNIPAN